MRDLRRIDVLGLATVGAIFGAIIALGFTENLWVGIVALAVFTFAILAATFDS